MKQQFKVGQHRHKWRHIDKAVTSDAYQKIADEWHTEYFCAGCGGREWQPVKAHRDDTETITLMAKDGAPPLTFELPTARDFELEGATCRQPDACQSDPTMQLHEGDTVNACKDCSMWYIMRLFGAKMAEGAGLDPESGIAAVERFMADRAAS